jgi:hypothetical protein
VFYAKKEWQTVCPKGVQFTTRIKRHLPYCKDLANANGICLETHGNAGTQRGAQLAELRTVIRNNSVALVEGNQV